MGLLLLLTLLFGQASQRPACDVAADETYAYTKERPVQVGGSPMYGAARQRRYLDTLRGPEGQPVKYKRTGSLQGSDGTFLDAYEVTYDGLEKPVTLYLDWYHYNPIRAPRGFSCAGPFNIGMPPVDPFKESDQLESVAIEQGATRDFEPIPLAADGVTHGAIYDQFRLLALASRAAAAVGKPLDAHNLPKDLRSLGMVIVSYPPACEERTLPPAGIALAGNNGQIVPRQDKGRLSAERLGRLLPGVELPKGAIAVEYQLSRPRPNDLVVLSYLEDGCGVTGNTRQLRVTVTPARGVEMPDAILPEGVSNPGPPMLLQVLIDTDGKIQRPEYVGGALELVEVAKASLSRWRVEPARVNGAPVPAGVVVQVRFAAQRRVHGREDGGRGADAEADGEEDGGGEARRAEQRADRDADVLGEVLQGHCALDGLQSRMVSRRVFLAAGSAWLAAARLGLAQAPRTRLVLLGTAGGPTPKVKSAAPAQAIVVGDRIYLVDCGDGVARQLALAKLPIRQLRSVFITHQHSDHNAGYGPLFLLGWAANLATPVDVYGPPPLTEMTAKLLEAYRFDIETRMQDEIRVPLAPLVRPHEITGGGEIFKDDRVRVTAALNEHPPIKHSFAFRFDTADRSIVISGDTNYSENVVKLARGADVLVHEVVSREFWERPNPPQPPSVVRHILASHTDAGDVGRVAAAAGVGTLVLSHFVPTEGPNAPTDDEWIAAVRHHYKGKVVVGKDLMEV